MLISGTGKPRGSNRNFDSPIYAIFTNLWIHEISNAAISKPINFKFNLCLVDDVSENMQYVDLLRNPERFTGYAGDSAHRIWHAFYQENCFHFAENKYPLNPANPYASLGIVDSFFFISFSLYLNNFWLK